MGRARDAEMKAACRKGAFFSLLGVTEGSGLTLSREEGGPSVILNCPFLAVSTLPCATGALSQALKGGTGF